MYKLGLKALACAILVALAACVGAAPGAVDNPQNIVFAAEGAEIVAIRAATVYKQLPLCAPMGPAVCSTAENVANIDQAIRAADAAVESAKRTVRNPAFDQGGAMAAAVAAREAVNALTTIVNTYSKR